MATPAVSIITPTRNRAKLLRETLDSVAAQAFSGWEHIVIDDGSEDGTAELMAARCADPRVRYIVRQCEPAGANACRNIGVRAAAAPLIVFLDSDDLLTPDCLARRVGVLRRNRDLDFAVSRGAPFVEKVGDLGRCFGGDDLGDDLCRFLYPDETPWQTSAPIWRRESLLRIGLFDEALPSWQDIELHVRAICAGCRYVRLPELDHHVRWQFEPTKVSIEQRRSPVHLASAVGVAERLERHIRAGPGMDWVRQRALCSLYFATADRWIERRDLGAALACWRQVRARRLGPAVLHAAGAALLVLRRLGLPTATAARKWKGWARLRTLPEIDPA